MNGRTSSCAQVASTHTTTRSPKTMERGKDLNWKVLAKLIRESRPGPAASSHSSHQCWPRRGGSPSDVQRSSRTARRMREIYATSARWAGLPSEVSHRPCAALVKTLVRYSSNIFRNWAR